MQTDQITIDEVLAFWFPDGPNPDPERHTDLWIWRMRGAAHDAVIARYTALCEQAAVGALNHWAQTPQGRLALIVVLDQFSRSVWAGTPRAFDQDMKALAWCLEGLDNGDFDALETAWYKTTFKLPMEHCECEDHSKNLDRAVAIAAAIARAAPEQLRQHYKLGAEMPAQHRTVIAAFGRQPHRNEILRRTSTPAEQAYLGRPARGDRRRSFDQHPLHRRLCRSERHPHPADRCPSRFRRRTPRGTQRPWQPDPPGGRETICHRPDPGRHPQRQFHRARGVGGRARHGVRHPVGAPRLYITIDIDAFCPSIAPGTGTPSHGGFLYYEVLELLQGAARAHEVVGLDLVELAPDHDPSGSTAILAAQLLLNTLGFILHSRRAGG